MRDLMMYEFVFVNEDGRKITKDIWAEYETEAWSRADDIAYAKGYVDYYLKEDEQEEEKAMNNRVILTKELDGLFTDVVNDYLCKGFKLNTATMAGHQGEIAKIDLTDGTDVYRMVMDNIKPCLINREQNKKMLDNVIHSPYVDLEVIYRVDVCHGTTCLLTKELAKALDITLSEAKQAAMNNIAKEIEVVSIVEILKKSALARGIPEDIVDDMFSEVSPSMYVITTKDGVNGAGAILCSETTARLNEFLGEKIYVFPSSRHEMIAVPEADFDNLDELKELVTTVNATEVSKDDYLSDSVYLWENGFMEVIA